MKTARVHLESLSPYSQSRHYSTPAREPKESPADYEKRTWRERMHYDADGHVYVPPMSLKNSLAEAAQFLGQKIPGKRNATWTKHFLAGTLVIDGVSLPIKKDDVPGEWLFLPSDGKKGGSSRVDKCFGRIDQWEGDATYHILDEEITKDVFVDHLKQAGQFIGLGFFRPARGGYWGRYSAELIDWQ
jgi:hypothetical protein